MKRSYSTGDIQEQETKGNHHSRYSTGDISNQDYIFHSKNYEEVQDHLIETLKKEYDIDDKTKDKIVRELSPALSYIVLRRDLQPKIEKMIIDALNSQRTTVSKMANVAGSKRYKIPTESLKAINHKIEQVYLHQNEKELLNNAIEKLNEKGEFVIDKKNSKKIIDGLKNALADAGFANYNKENKTKEEELIKIINKGLKNKRTWISKVANFVGIQFYQISSKSLSEINKDIKSKTQTLNPSPDNTPTNEQRVKDKVKKIGTKSPFER